MLEKVQGKFGEKVGESFGESSGILERTLG
jgi:hypothetical protein